MTRIKYIRRQDCVWKCSFGFSGETSINLSQEILFYLCEDYIMQGDELDLLFRIYKDDFIEAVDFIQTQLPLYVSSSRTCELINCNDEKINVLNKRLESFFGNEKYVDYPITIYCRHDGRIYMKGLRQNGFSIRDYLVENGSALEFSIEDGLYELRIISGITEGQ